MPDNLAPCLYAGHARAPQVVADPQGQHWLLLGTSRGWLRLWDVRFLLQANSWQHPGR